MLGQVEQLSGFQAGIVTGSHIRLSRQARRPASSFQADRQDSKGNSFSLHCQVENRTTAFRRPKLISKATPRQSVATKASSESANPVRYLALSDQSSALLLAALQAPFRFKLKPFVRSTVRLILICCSPVSCTTTLVAVCACRNHCCS